MASSFNGALSRCYVEMTATGRSSAIFARYCLARPRRQPKVRKRPSRRRPFPPETPANTPAGTLPAIVDEFIKLLDAFTRLAGAIVLPIVVFAVFWLFRTEIRALVGRTESLSVKGGPLDVTISAQKAQAAGAIAAAVALKPVEGQDAKARAQTAQAAASVVAASVTPQGVQKAQAVTVLWVDDNPDNKISVRRSLEALGGPGR